MTTSDGTPGRSEPDHRKCHLCDKMFIESGQNPSPLVDMKDSHNHHLRCCVDCFLEYVIPRHFEEFFIERGIDPDSVKIMCGRKKH